MFLIFHLLIAIAIGSPVDTYSDGHTNCAGTWISKQGHFLTSLDCLQKCAVEQGVGQSHRNGFTVKGPLPQSMSCSNLNLKCNHRVVIMGNGTLNYNMEELSNLSEEQIINLKQSKRFNGDGNYAILKTDLQTKECLKISPTVLTEEKHLKIYGEKNDLSFLAVWGAASSLFSWEGLKNLYSRSVLKDRDKLLSQVYLTPYSHIAKYDFNLNGWPVLNQFDEIEGITQTIDNGFVKVIKADYIFKSVFKVLGNDEALKIFNCED